MNANARVISIDRTAPFNSVSFIGTGWSVIEQDERSLVLPTVDPNKIQLVTLLTSGEASVFGEEKLKRLVASGSIRLDAKVLQTFWENQHLIPLSWKKKTNGEVTLIFFDGTILQGSDGRRYDLYLCWLDRGWFWNALRLNTSRSVRYPSVVLAS